MKQREEDLVKNKIITFKNPDEMATPAICMDNYNLIHSFTKSLKMKWIQKFINTTQTNVLILSHNDADGHGSGAVIYLYHYTNDINPVVYNIDGYEFDYSAIKDKIHDADIVYITDLSLNQKTMEYIMSNVKEDGLVCCIDHHLSSTSVHIDDDRLFQFVHSEIGISAAALCCAYHTFIVSVAKMIHNEGWNSPTIHDINECICQNVGKQFIIPPIIRYISLYDTFHDDMDLRFTYGFNTIEHNINSDQGLMFWKCVLYDYHHSGKEYVDHIINNGEVIKNYVDTDYARIRKDQLIEVTFHIIDNTGSSKKEYDCTAAILNINAFSMSFGPEIETHDICIRYYQKTDGTWSYGCYSSKVRDTTMNCMQFAKHFGGGGHIHAAGFSTKQNVVNQWIHSSEKDGKITLYLEK